MTPLYSITIPPSKERWKQQQQQHHHQHHSQQKQQQLYNHQDIHHHFQYYPFIGSMWNTYCGGAVVVAVLLLLMLFVHSWFSSNWSYNYYLPSLSLFPITDVVATASDRKQEAEQLPLTPTTAIMTSNDNITMRTTKVLDSNKDSNKHDMYQHQNQQQEILSSTTETKRVVSMVRQRKQQQKQEPNQIKNMLLFPDGTTKTSRNMEEHEEKDVGTYPQEKDVVASYEYRQNSVPTVSPVYTTISTTGTVTASAMINSLLQTDTTVTIPPNIQSQQQQQQQQQQQHFLRVEFSLWIPIFNNDKCYNRQQQQHNHNHPSISSEEYYNYYLELTKTNANISTNGSTTNNTMINNNNNNNPIQQKVLHSLIVLLCNETDLLFVNATTTFQSSNYNGLLYDYCTNISYVNKAMEANNATSTGTVFTNDNVTTPATTTTTTTTTSLSKSTYVSIIGITPISVIVESFSITDINYGTTIKSNNITNLQPNYAIHQKRDQVTTNNKNEDNVNDEDDDDDHQLSGRLPELTLSWTTWTIVYPILQIGDTYTQEGLYDILNVSNTTNSSTSSSFNNVSNNILNGNSSLTSVTNVTLLMEKSIQAMNEIVQSVIDKSILNGVFDSILLLNSSSGSMSQQPHIPIVQRYYSSIVTYEWDTFASLYNAYIATRPFIVKPIHPLRVCGIIIFAISILLFLLLLYLSNRRRRRINYKQTESQTAAGGGGGGDGANAADTVNKAKQLSTTNEEISIHGRWLTSNKTVDDMLNRSFEFYCPSTAPVDTTTTNSNEVVSLSTKGTNNVETVSVHCSTVKNSTKKLISTSSNIMKPIRNHIKNSNILPNRKQQVPIPSKLLSSTTKTTTTSKASASPQDNVAMQHKSDHTSCTFDISNEEKGISVNGITNTVPPPTTTTGSTTNLDNVGKFVDEILEINKCSTLDQEAEIVEDDDDIKSIPEPLSTTTSTTTISGIVVDKIVESTK